MKKYISLVVLGSLLSAAALNASAPLDATLSAGDAGATITNAPEPLNVPPTNAPEIIGSTNPDAPQPPAEKVGNDNTPADAKTAGGIMASVTQNVFVKNMTKFVQENRALSASVAVAAFGAFTLWKCSWVRRKLGIEDEKDTRAVDEYEKLFASKAK